MNKFGAKRTTVDGVTFDSRREANRWLELRLLARSGQITDLERQPAFVLLDDFVYRGRKVRGITYRADFRYKMGGQDVVEDVKGFLTKDYQLKKKLFLAKFPELHHIET